MMIHTKTKSRIRPIRKKKKTDMSGHIKEEDFFFLRGGTHVCSCGMRAPIRGEDPKEESLL